MLKLSKIIPPFASDQPGEVTAAVAAAGRILKAADRDWNWLAQAVLSGSYFPTQDDSLLKLALARAKIDSLSRDLRAEQSDTVVLRIENARLMKELAKLRAARSQESTTSTPSETPEDPKRFAVRATMMLNDTKFYLTPTDSTFLKKIERMCIIHKDLPDSVEEAFDTLWRRYRTSVSK